MPFPIPGAKFPSDEWLLAYEQFRENDAWWSGDQAALQAIYENAGTRTRGDNAATHYNKGDGTLRRGGLRGRLASFFNGNIVNTEEQRTRIHAPVASNLATLSSDLLFAEPATFRLTNAKGDPYKGKAQDRMDVVLNGEDNHLALIESAEKVAGLSAVVMTAHWDRDTSDKPWMEATACDAVIPEFIGRRLVAVNMYTTYNVTSALGLVEATFVHIERHEQGYIIHGLMKLNADRTLSDTVPLQTVAALEHLAFIPGSQQGVIEHTIALPTGIKSLTASWWRHLPTKTFRKYGELQMLGRAVFEGSEQMLDAVDETWSSWMRDIKIGRARLIVPEAFLDVQGPGMGGAFDTDRELLTALAFTDLNSDGEKISAHQFLIRAKDHADTLLGLTKEITQASGYSLSSYGEQSEGGGITATETVDRTTMTERTRDKQFLYASRALHPLSYALMELDAVHYAGTAIPNDAVLDIEITELSQVDPEKEARTIQYLRNGMAATTDTIVRMQHPDWDETRIQQEVEGIREENNLGLELSADEGRVIPRDGEDPTDPTIDPATDPAGATSQLAQ